MTDVPPAPPGTSVAVDDIRVGETLTEPIFMPDGGPPLLAAGRVVTADHLDGLRRAGVREVRRGDPRDDLPVGDHASTVDPPGSSQPPLLARAIGPRDVPPGAGQEDVVAIRLLADLIHACGRSPDPVARALGAQVGRRAAEALEAGIALVVGSARMRDLLLGLGGLRPGFLGPAYETSLMSAIVGAHRRWSDERLERMAISGFLADIGMLALSDDVVEKPGPLSPSEEGAMRRHPEIGARLLTPLAGELPAVVAEVALQHHERVDGRGYPRGLAGAQVLEEAQVVAICHLYLAAVTGRCYRRALAPWKVLALLRRTAGSHADPRLVRAFIESVAVHPVGALARLSSGECGRILPGGRPLSPIVEVRWDADGTPVHPRRVIAEPRDDRLHVVAVGRATAR